MKGTVDIIELNGVKIAIDQQSVSRKMLKVIQDGWYEREEAAQIPVIVQKGDRIVELGGGIGYISTLAAMQGKAEEITVYEANPDLIPLIRRTHELNRVNVRVVHAAVLPQATSSTIDFYVREDFWASSLAAEPYGYDKVVQVPVVPFADMLSALRPSMLIVDIEGGEGALFDNVPLTGIKKVYLEMHQDLLGRAGVKRLFDFFSARDFHYDQWHSAHGVILFSHVLR